MGCCASTNKPPPSPQLHRHSSKSSRAPPPVDEETVKEVLSETPNPNHFTKIGNQPRKITPRNSLTKIQKQQKYNLDEVNVSGEVSEICSNMSETVSTTTIEEDVEVLRRRVTDRSPGKLRNRQPVSGELRMLRNSPVKGKQQSPGRVRSGPGLGNEMSNRGPGFGSTGRQRPVPGNVPVGRSRSPANRTAARGGGGVRNGMGRSPSAKRRENSPGRVGLKLPENISMKPDVNSGYDLRVEESGWGPSPIDRNDDESFDNPLVSLECFIFL